MKQKDRALIEEGLDEMGPDPIDEFDGEEDEPVARLSRKHEQAQPFVDADVE